MLGELISDASDEYKEPFIEDDAFKDACTWKGVQCDASSRVISHISSEYNLITIFTHIIIFKNVQSRNQSSTNSS